MGKLKVTFGGAILPIEIIRLDRQLTPPMNHTTQTIGNGDGVLLVNSSYAEKKIEIEYMINNYTASDLNNFRNTMALLIGSKEPQRLIFSDEPNKYYNAVITGEPTLDENHLQSVGSLTFLITDGVAHSTNIIQVPATTKNGILTAHIDNDSSAAVYPVYRIKHATENGYLGIVHPGGAFEMGNREEADKVAYQQSEVLTTGMSDYLAYTGTNPKNSAILNNGSLRLMSDGYYRLESIGSGSHWHGGSRRWVLPADSNGEVGAKNFYLWFRVQFMTGLMAQTGLIQVMLADANNNLIAAFELHKDDMVGNTAYAQAWVGGNSLREVFKFNFTPTIRTNDNWFAQNKGNEDIVKTGRKIRFFYWGRYYEADVPELENVKVSSVHIFIGQYAARNATNQIVSAMGVCDIRGRKDYVNKIKDVPNRYAAGSEIVVDTSSDSIMVNGLPANDELVDGSEFATLPIGETDIEFYPSSWCQTKPTVTVEYRKRWL